MNHSLFVAIPGCIIYRLMAQRAFPTPVKLAKRSVGWRQHDVREWNEARPQARR